MHGGRSSRLSSRRGVHAGQDTCGWPTDGPWVWAQVFPAGHGEPWKSDREIMRYTMQRGKHVVKAGEVCGNLRREVQIAGKTKRVGLPTQVWEDVTSAGFAAHPVGEHVGAGKKTSRIIWARVPVRRT